MKVTIFPKGRAKMEFDAEHCVGASGSYPYWVIWEPVDESGQQAVHFIPKEDIQHVTMYGEPEGKDKEKPDLKVVPFSRGGDEPNGTV